HIEETLHRIPEEIWQAITVAYVIDDCSTDETVEKALSFQKHREQLVVLRNPVNQMYGGNQKLGYQYAIANNLDVVVMLHADGQYAPEYLGQILAPVVRGDADVVIGSRMLRKRDALRGGMPRYKFLGNIILTRIQNALTGMSLSEFHSGYRAYSTRFLKTIPFWENTDSWHFDTEILLEAKEYGCKIQEIPVPTYYGSEICRVNGILYAFNCVKASFRYYLFRKRILYSRAFDISPEGQRYSAKFADPFSSHSKIITRLEQEGLSGKKVLEVGVGDASLIKKMVEMGATVDAIEMDPVGAELARQLCRAVYQKNLEDLDRIDVEDQYDVIVMADVLEHLRNP
ncbi:MAG: glycosyltransferase, partial [Nitrososphaera sp.]